MFFEKKELRPLEVRPWICVFLKFKILFFYIFNFLFKIEMD
jgi:hypothetical protein